jgi:hypothetical protein
MTGLIRDYKAICERSQIVVLDEQARNDATGFQHNGEAGKLIHGLLGWDKTSLSRSYPVRLA